MTELITLIGGRGGGKSTLVTLLMQICGQEYPWVQRVGNVHMTGCKYVDDILKFLALKMIAHDMTFMEVVIDEAALSGLESRGSGMKSLDSYLIALSRKLNVDIWLISQLMSMVEKRAQWLSDFYIYCKSHVPEGTRDPDYYTFEVYNEDLRLVNVLELMGKNAHQVYPLFDTEEVPFAESLAKQFASYYEITEEDISEFKALMKS